MKPKVVLVGSGFSGGGAEGRFKNISRNLFSGTADVAVLVAGNIPEDINASRLVDLRWTNRYSYARAIWILARRIRRERYQVLMAFGLFPILISLVSVAVSGAHTKVVINEITRPQLEGAKGRWWRRLVYRKLRQWLYSRSDLITANSIDGLQETCYLAGVPLDVGLRVPNVIDQADLRKRMLANPDLLSSDGRYVICVGRLDFMKRIDTVIDAIHRLPGSIRCGLLVVGDGPARQYLEAHAGLRGLKEVIQFTGWLDNPLPLMKGAAAFVLASEYEGYSNSLLEAMFCDIPVITSLCSSDAREICDQAVALGFDVGDSFRLAECISAVVSDVGLARQLVERAQNYRAIHELRNAIPSYERLILEVIEGKVEVD